MAVTKIDPQSWIPHSDTLVWKYSTISDEERDTILKGAAGVIAAYATTLFSEYPIQSGKPLAPFYTRQRADGTPYQSKFKTMKQQRYVMALMARSSARLKKKGKKVLAAGVHYRRTGTLGKSINARTVPVERMVVNIVVGSGLIYAPYVIGDPATEQSHYHTGTWPSLRAKLTSPYEMKFIRDSAREYVYKAAKDLAKKKSS